MKKFIFIFFMIIFLVTDVFASEYNMNSHTSGSLDGTKNRYRGTEIYNTGTSNIYTFGTRYNGKLSIIDAYFDYPFEANTTYTLTYNMNTEDFRNSFGARYWWDCDDEMNATNQHLGSFTYVSYKKVKFSFTPTENTTCIRVMIGSSNASSQAITGISNWRLDSITLYDPAFQSGSGSGQGSTSSPSPTPSGATNQDIINSNEDNTQDIINNQNDNTQDIIDNNNENTDKIIDNQNDLLGNRCSNLLDMSKVSACTLNNNNSTVYCPTNPIVINSINEDTGSIDFNAPASWRGFMFDDFISVDPNTTYYIKFSSSNFTSNLIKVSHFGVFQNYLTQSQFYNTLSSRSFTTGPETHFIKISFESSASGNNFVINSLYLGKTDNSYCKFNSYTSKLDDLNDSINNSNIDDKTGFFTDFEDNTHGLSGIITLPLSTIQSLTNTSCVSLSIPIPFTNSNVSLPCMTEVYQTYIPSVYNIWQVVSFGIISYFICLDIFKMVKGFKDPNEDKVEVLDL